MLPIKRLDERAILPKRATAGSAGFDLFACIDNAVVISPNETVGIPTKIAIQLDSGTVGLIYARSSLGVRYNVTPANCVGVIDSDYRGELVIFLVNNGDEEYVVNYGDRIAQLVITPVCTPEIIEVKELNDSERGVGGFGSTGR